jgi:hypothetical protein
MPDELLHQLAELGEASAMIAAAAALVGLWLTVREYQRTAREKEILEWQKVIVYEIIRKRGPIAAADILGFYLDQEQLFSISILKNKMLRGDALTSILLNLIAEHAIMVLPEEDGEAEYAIVRATRQQMPDDTFSAMDARNLQQAKDIRDLLYHIEQNNGKFTIAELKEYLERTAKYEKSRIDAVDDFLLRFETLYQFVARDKDGIRQTEEAGRQTPKLEEAR